MGARALVCDHNQQFTLTDVILPDPGDNDVLIRALYSGVSVGTEFALIRNKLSWGPYPICTGYQGVGVIEQAGSHVAGFEAGQTVYYRHNRRIQLPDGRRVSGVSGVHCSRALVDMGGDPQVAPLPDGVAEDAGSLFVMPSVGLHGVDMANPRTGEAVLVYGAGLIGLGVVAAASYRGAVVIAVDVQPRRLAAAGELGADHVIDAGRQDVGAELKAVAPQGADVVFECTGLPECIDTAIALCRDHGTFVLQGNYGARPISWHFLPAHGRQLKMLFPCDDGGPACRRAVMKNMAAGALKWEVTLTHRVEAADAARFYADLNANEVKDLVGAVIHWS